MKINNDQELNKDPKTYLCQFIITIFYYWIDSLNRHLSNLIPCLM